MQRLQGAAAFPSRSLRKGKPEAENQTSKAGFRNSEALPSVVSAQPTCPSPIFGLLGGANCRGKHRLGS